MRLSAFSAEQPQRKAFATTHWSIVLRAGTSAKEGANQALADLFQKYWYPLYAFCRRQGNSDHDALDLTQGFFAQLLSSDALETVTPEKGRFRSFLLASFKNFMANQRRAAATIRRGGNIVTLSLSAAEFQTRYDREPAHEETPEVLFERSWVESLLARVKEQLSNDYELAGKRELFQLLEPHLTHQGDAIPRAEIGRRLKLSSAAIAMSIHRMRRRYGELLRIEVAATLDDASEIEAELRTLLQLIGSDSR